MGLRLPGQLTALRSATDADVELLVAWHRDPEVRRYWDGETFTSQEMAVRLARPTVEAFIVEEDGRPVGYLQAWTDEATGGGLDMFLIPGARGRGLGPDAAGTLALHLLRERGWARVTTDPYVWNDGAVRAWARAGFVAVGEREPDAEHTASWLLMEFRP